MANKHMKIAVVSDTHNNWVNFKKAIDWIKKEKISLILHCGDIASQEIINEANKYFAALQGEPRQRRASTIHFVKGNGDYGLDLPEKMELELDKNKIAFTHLPNTAKKLAQSGKYDLVFYGHTHRPCLSRRSPSERDEGGGGGKIKQCLLVNPGELAGQLYKPSFAVYDTITGNLELKILEQL